MTRWWRPLGLLVAAAGSLGWFDPSATPRAAARLFAAGKFDDAVTRYNEALIDEPDSDLLHFNLGDAEYRRGQFDAAVRAFQRVPQDAAADYNRGNALFRKGEGAQTEKPQEALTHWAEALVAYRRAIGTDPTDEDAKYNYEWVSRKVEELKKKLEEQQQQDQQQDQQQQDQPKDEPGDQAEQGGQPKSPEPQPEPPPGEAQQDDAPSDGRMSRDEATALLDGERAEELQPDEVIRRQLGTGDGPAQDW